MNGIPAKLLAEWQVVQSGALKAGSRVSAQPLLCPGPTPCPPTCSGVTGKALMGGKSRI